MLFLTIIYKYEGSILKKKSLSFPDKYNINGEFFSIRHFIRLIIREKTLLLYQHRHNGMKQTIPDIKEPKTP
ncbi:MAG: hypothetical protein J6X26_04225, partial [Bacteroidales bacterium]|nr:hypothetical protein [Bacteroidales bacterium]